MVHAPIATSDTVELFVPLRVQTAEVVLLYDTSSPLLAVAPSAKLPLPILLSASGPKVIVWATWHEPVVKVASLPLVVPPLFVATARKWYRVPQVRPLAKAD